MPGHQEEHEVCPPEVVVGDRSRSCNVFCKEQGHQQGQMVMGPDTEHGKYDHCRCRVLATEDQSVVDMYMCKAEDPIPVAPKPKEIHEDCPKHVKQGDSSVSCNVYCKDLNKDWAGQMVRIEHDSDEEDSTGEYDHCRCRVMEGNAPRYVHNCRSTEWARTEL